MTTLHASARHEATHSGPVFPLHTPEATGQCSCRVANCQNVGKHPRTSNGLHDATQILAQIDRWWQQWPEANIGLLTGKASGRFVVDIDPKDGGYETIDALQARHGAMPATLAVETGSDGLHLHYAYPDTGVIRNSAGKLGPGVDIRGQGGYVLLPPSLHRSGRHYRWTGLDDATEVAPAPDWLLSLIVEHPRTARPPAATAPAEGPIPEGQRNSTLAQKAGALRRHGFSETEILAALEQMNLERCRPPLPEAEVGRIARSVARYPPSAPPRGPASPQREIRLASGAALRPIARGGRYGD